MSASKQRESGKRGGDDADRRGQEVPSIQPPRVAVAILARLLPPYERDEILGDMAESHARRSRHRGRPLLAHVWYGRQSLAIPVRLRWWHAVRSFSSQEIGQTLRGLRRSPVFAAVAVLSLSLGIGANTAIFSVIRSALYTPLAVDRPEELRLVYWEHGAAKGVRQYSSSSDEHPVTGATIHSNYSYPIYQRLRAAAGPSVDILGYNFVHEVALVVDDRPAVSAAALMASGDYFSTLRLRTVIGRPFDAGDDRPEAARVAVLSHAFWLREFGADPAVVGRAVSINGQPFEVIGVTAPGFDGLSPGGFFPATDITVPLSTQTAVAPTWTPAAGSLPAAESIYWVRTIVRIPEGTVAEPIEEAMTAALRESLLSTSTIAPEDADQVRVDFVDGSRGLDSLRRNIQRPLTILAGVVAAVLLIACVNLASLTLARGDARRHELALRRALGAGRLRLVRQLLLESLLLAGAGGLAGLLLALWSGPALTAALTAGMGRVAVRFQLDWMLLGVVILVSLLAAALCGLLPAFRLTRRGALDGLHARSFSDGGGRFTLGRMLIAVQIAVSIPLLVGAGLFLRTLVNLGDVELGFDADNLVIFEVQPALVTDDGERVAAIYRQVLDGVEALPGVSSATLVENALLSGWISNTSVSIDGEETGMYMNAVGPRFFELMRIPLLSGRTIIPTDGAGAPFVMVVNQTAERELFDGHALGRTVLRDDKEFQVVGVVADSKYESLQNEITPTFYDSYLQRGNSRAHVLVRTPVPADRLERSIRDVVARVDPGLPVTGLRSQSEQIDVATSRERVFARLLGLFGAFALLVAAVGLYGVTSFVVSRRRPELGVRLALGARPPQILWLVLRSVLVIAAVGMALGLPAAYLVGPVVDSMLYGLEPADPLTLAGAAGVMLAVAVAAGWLPARRAARTDALIVLSRD